MKKKEKKELKDVLKNDELIVIRGGRAAVFAKDCGPKYASLHITDCDNAS